MCVYSVACAPPCSLTLTVGVVVGFNVSYTKAVEALARLRGVTLLTHNVIYKLLELFKVCVCVCVCVKSGFIVLFLSSPHYTKHLSSHSSTILIAV